MIAVDITDGVLGLEAVHTVYGIALNDLSVSPFTVARARFDHIAGLHDLPEKDDNRAPRTGRKGEQTFAGQLRGKNITYTGRVQAPTRQLMRRFVRQMRTAFATEDETWVQVAPNPAYGAGLAWQFRARVATFVCDDNQASYGPDAMPTRWQRDFTLTLRQSDPRYYVATLNDSGPHNDGDTVTVHNAGDIDTELVITGAAAGPAGTVVIRNLTPAVNAGIGLKGVPAGTIEVSSYDRSITLNGTPDPGLYDDSAVSDWWDEATPTLLPGDNSIQVTGLSNWHAQWNDASV